MRRRGGLVSHLAAIGPGDIVDVVAPASRCSREDFNGAIRRLRDLGLIPRVPKGMFAPSVLFSNRDEKRLSDLTAALLAPDSKIVWCLRGGYGSLRLLADLKGIKRPRHKKIFVGYSDITTLHAFLNQEWNWPTYHGPMLDRFGRDTTHASERRFLMDLLRGKSVMLEFKGLKPVNRAARRVQTLRGPVLGGNMAVLQSTMGTRFELDPQGAILFFEDIGERPHRVDRMLTQFALGGWFARARAVVFGHFLLNEAGDRRQLWSDVIPRFAEAQRIPVLKGLPAGHDPRRNLTVPFNTAAELKTGRRGAVLNIQSWIEAPPK